MNMDIKNSIEKLKAKLKFYFSLNHEFRLLRLDIDRLLNSPPWLHLLNQDRFRLTEMLDQIRGTVRYQKSFTDKNPLVTVRIATYNNSDELINRAIPSVINQTYKNWEIVIVGDYSTDDTEDRIKKLNHPRIRYTDLSYHYPYPEYQIHRWMAQGLLAHNQAIKMAKGTWIAPLDDDNEFLPFHIEKLLQKARKEKLELVYGNMISIDRITGETKKIGGFPPHVGNFDFSACIYNFALNVFPFDINSYLYQEVGDTNLIRRLRESGVKMGFLNRYVTRYYFRQPGSPRTSVEFPNKKGVYSILQVIQKVNGKLTLPQADLLYDALESCQDEILLIGNKNKKITAFIQEFVRINSVPNLVYLNEDKKIEAKKKFEFIILNLPVNRNVDLRHFLNYIEVGGLMYLCDCPEDKLDNFIKANEDIRLIENNLLMKF